VDPVVGVTPQHNMHAFQELNTPTNNGNKLRIPVVGLGVYQSTPGDETEHAVLKALQIGYRHVDSAFIYGNEQSVGAAIKKSGIPREQIFVTTKLWNDHHGYESTLKACDDSLKRLGLDYIDLYLIHWPVPEKRLDTWRAFEKLQADGKVRSIGVSNYMVRHLEELFAHCKVKPAVNQIEFSPYNTRKDVVAFCKKHGIVVEAYSPLTQGIMFDDPKLIEIAKKYNVTPAKVLLRYGLQCGTVTLPKSVHEQRIRDNINIFDFSITPEDMELLHTFNQGFTTGWDPVNAP